MFSFAHRYSVASNSVGEILQTSIQLLCTASTNSSTTDRTVRGLSISSSYMHSGLITSVHSLMLSWSLPVYQVRLDWLPLPCIASIRLSQLSCLGSSVGSASAS